MSVTQTGEVAPPQPLRLWPGVAIAALVVLVAFGAPLLLEDGTGIALIAGAAGGLAILLWWVLFSRARWLERLGAVALLIVALLAARPLLHDSVLTAGMGVLFFIYAIPVAGVALVVWAVATRNLADGVRRAALVATVLASCLFWTLLRSGGITGDSESEFAWRWSATPEERLMAMAGDEAMAPLPTAGAIVAEPEWPGFRGPRRDGVVTGVRIDTDWVASPPALLWRQPVGPGWSSFAVQGSVLYTQEQRGEDEVVSAYHVASGLAVWRHADAARFWESNGGAGPRGTPTLSDGAVYTLGATGILNALAATNGTVLWSRNAAADTETEAPGWGFSSSPLVVGDLLVVATSGQLVAYDRATGEPRWFGPESRGGYSSPHLVMLDGVAQIVMLTGDGVVSVTPDTGAVLWEYAWQGVPIVQPFLFGGSDFVISTGGASGALGARRIAVTHGSDGWSTQQRWESIRLKPYYNDFVVHRGHAYGFDGSILACVDADSGERVWKGGRYGHGQLLLLADQDLLLVLSEEGELALVGATPDGFTEIARVPAIDGKTWNHPVLVGDLLLVRNGQEMAAFRLTLAP